jgi:plasmid replication initiation protein
MSKEIVKYHNDLNGIALTGLSTAEVNLFVGVLYRVKEQQAAEIVIPFAELRQLTDWESSHPKWSNAKFSQDLKRMFRKLHMITGELNDGDSWELYTLFTKSKVDINTMSLTVKVNEDYAYLLNNLTQQFTSFELQEFVQLSTEYGKTLYRLLKQWKTKGVKEFSVEKFRELLNVPDSYTSSDIRKRVLTAKTKAELEAAFPGLKIEEVKGNGRGRPIVSYVFTWKPECIVKKESEWRNRQAKKTNKKVDPPKQIPEWHEEDYQERQMTPQELDEWNQIISGNDSSQAETTQQYQLSPEQLAALNKLVEGEELSEAELATLQVAS